jgi:hypothetical protein
MPPEARSPELAILIGLQAAGKTTFFRRRLAGTHAHVSKDNFPNTRRRQRRQMRLVEEALRAGRDVAVDNTNPSLDEWRPLIEMARAYGARVIGYWFEPDLPASLERNAAREGRARIPAVGLYDTAGRLRRPDLAAGFDALYQVSFDGAGDFTIRPMPDGADGADGDAYGAL